MRWILYWTMLSLALAVVCYLLPRNWNPLRWVVSLFAWRQVATVWGVCYQVNTVTKKRRVFVPPGRKPNIDWVEGRVDDPADNAWRVRTVPPAPRPSGMNGSTDHRQC